nr:hypothetical protein CFP56_63345 [Quercus suber]
MRQTRQSSDRLSRESPGELFSTVPRPRSANSISILRYPSHHVTSHHVAHWAEVGFEVIETRTNSSITACGTPVEYAMIPGGNSAGSVGALCTTMNDPSPVFVT